MTPDIGEILAEARRKRGLSVKDVEEALKIRSRYIHALESGDRSAIHGEAYAVAFLRSYATYLGLDADDLTRAYRGQGPEASQTAVAKLPPYTPSIRERPKKGRGWLAIAVIVVFIAALVTARAVTPATKVAKPAKLSPKKESVEKQPTSSLQIKKAAPGFSLTLDAQASGGAWLRVTADGKVVFEGILPANQPREWRANESILVRTGKPSKVIVRKDGKLLGPVAGGVGVVEKLYKAGD